MRARAAAITVACGSALAFLGWVSTAAANGHSLEVLPDPCTSSKFPPTAPAEPPSPSEDTCRLTREWNESYQPPPTPSHGVRKLLLHVGSWKTGSSSMQSAWLFNKQELRARGIGFPRSGKWWKLVHCGLTLAGQDSKAMKTPYKAQFNETFEVLKFLQTFEGNVILTCEGFSNLQSFRLRLLRDLVSDFDVTVVYTYRNALSKMFSQFRFNSMKGVILESASDYFWHGPWDETEAIANLVTVFGRERVRILDYDGVLFAGESLANVALRAAFGPALDLSLSRQNLINPSQPPTYYYIKSLLTYFSIYVRGKYGCKVALEDWTNYSELYLADFADQIPVKSSGPKPLFAQGALVYDSWVRTQYCDIMWFGGMGRLPLLKEIESTLPLYVLDVKRFHAQFDLWAQRFDEQYLKRGQAGQFECVLSRV